MGIKVFEFIVLVIMFIRSAKMQATNYIYQKKAVRTAFLFKLIRVVINNLGSESKYQIPEYLSELAE